jgi:alkylation response protein AidB-like acyl-CoA dehydrogenase
MQARAAGLDAQAAFPAEDFAALRALGALRATLPEARGGFGFGTGEAGAQALLALLALLGEGSLAVARLMEAHINALQLIRRYGSDRLVDWAETAACAGELFGLWVTDPPQGGVREADGALAGAKQFCSGAGHCARALITAETQQGIRMLVLATPPEHASRSDIALAGMRAAVTGSYDFSGVAVADWQVLGAPGDYLREPVFSAGAWRASAAAFGGLTALVKLHRDTLRRRGRDGDAHQRARFGEVLIAHETARLWLEKAARIACLEVATEEEVVAYVNLARIAVEAACLEALRLFQRGLGLQAFLAGSTAERILRDLAVFLRQPAPDETLDRAAAYYFAGELP